MPQWRHAMQRQAPLPSAPSGPPAAANPQPVWYASPGAPRDRCPRLPWGPAALPLGGTRSLWRETCASAVAGPPAWPRETSLSNTTCESAGPFPGWSSTKPAWPPGTVVAGLRPQSPRGPAPDPLRLVVLALWRAGPVLRQNSARLMCPRSSGRPASRAMPSRASSMILCRSSRPSLISFVLLTPAHRHDASVGTNGGRDDSAPRVDG